MLKMADREKYKTNSVPCIYRSNRLERFLRFLMLIDMHCVVRDCW